MGPEVHHLCPVSGTSVEGATGEIASSSTLVEIGTERRNFWPLHLLRVCAGGLDCQILSKCVSLVLLMGTHGL